MRQSSSPGFGQRHGTLRPLLALALTLAGAFAAAVVYLGGHSVAAVLVGAAVVGGACLAWRDQP